MQLLFNVERRIHLCDVVEQGGDRHGVIDLNDKNDKNSYKFHESKKVSKTMD